MSWNHRLFREILPNGDEYFSIREIFYNKDGSISGHTIDAVDLSSETIDGLRWTLEKCLDSLDNPILNENEIIFVDKENND